MATQPSPSAISAVPAKRPIDQREALRGVLRAWLAARDAALWIFCQGVEIFDVDICIGEIKLEEAQAAVEQANRLLVSAVSIAGSIALKGQTAQDVIREEMHSLLATESPKFLLRVENLPEAF